jgi:hypothetical protein
MATKRPKGNRAVQPLQRIQKEGERLYHRLRKDAEALLERGRKQIADDVRVVQRRADAATRKLEASLLKRLHAASESQLRRLERRVVALEQQIVGLQRRETSGIDGGAAA